MAGPSNPAATIKWNIDSDQVENSVTRTVPNSNNGWISYSNTTVFIPPNATFVSVHCHGVNSHISGPQKWLNHKITVLRKWKFAKFIKVANYKSYFHNYILVVHHVSLSLSQKIKNKLKQKIHDFNYITWLVLRENS